MPERSIYGRMGMSRRAQESLRRRLGLFLLSEIFSDALVAPLVGNTSACLFFLSSLTGSTADLAQTPAVEKMYGRAVCFSSADEMIVSQIQRRQVSRVTKCMSCCS